MMSMTSSGGFIVNFEHISHLFLVFLLYTLNKLLLAGLPLYQSPKHIFQEEMKCRHNSCFDIFNIKVHALFRCFNDWIWTSFTQLPLFYMSFLTVLFSILFPPNTRTCLYVSEGKKCLFFRKFCFVYLLPSSWDSPFCLITAAYFTWFIGLGEG